MRLLAEHGDRLPRDLEFSSLAVFKSWVDIYLLWMGYENLIPPWRKGPKYTECLSFPALLQLMQKPVNYAVQGSLNRPNK